MSHHIQPHTCECSLHLCMYNSGWEGINHFAIFGGDYFIIFNRIQHLGSDLVIFHCGSGLSNCQKIGHMGIDPGSHQCIYLLSYHIHDVAYCGGSQDRGDQICEVGQIWDYEGYSILIIALDSIYLNPYDDIANRPSEGVSLACPDDSSAHKVWEKPHVQGVILNEPWHNGVDLGTIVQESHASLSIDSYPGYVLNAVLLIKGIRFKKRVCVLHLGCPILGHLCLRGLGPLLWCHPLFSV